MSSFPIQIDAEIIDELVAGNLKGEEYRQVLRSLEAQPEKWRDCALAFLEEQAITRDLKALAAIADDASESVPNAVEGDFDTVELVSPSHSATTTNRSTEFAQLQWMHRFTSLAALLLISFTVGWFGSGILRQGQASASATGNSGNPIRPNDLSGTDPSVESPELGAPALGSPNDSKPLDGLQFVDQMIPVQQDTPDFLRELKRRGRTEVESYPALVPVMEGDSIILVPVQQHRVRGRSSF